MTRPTPDNIEVSLAALRAEANRWDAVSDLLHDLHIDVSARSTLGTTEFGIFGPFHAIHSSGCGKLASVMSQGAAEAQRIADTLVGVARTYQAEDETNADSARSIHEIYQAW